MIDVKYEFTERSRTRAMSMKSRLLGMGLEISLGQAYELLAAADGFRNWPTMKSEGIGREVAAAKPIPLPVVQPISRIDQIVNDFVAFSEGRQKSFRPVNRILVTGGNKAERIEFAQSIAKGIGREIFLVTKALTHSNFDPTAVLEDCFTRAFNANKILYLDDVGKLAANHIRHATQMNMKLDAVPAGDFVILGSDLSEPLIEKSTLLRVQYVHSLDRRSIH